MVRHYFLPLMLLKLKPKDEVEEQGLKLTISSTNIRAPLRMEFSSSEKS